jgi:hypothetical protein
MQDSTDGSGSLNQPSSNMIDTGVGGHTMMNNNEVVGSGGYSTQGRVILGLFSIINMSNFVMQQKNRNDAID